MQNQSSICQGGMTRKSEDNFRTGHNFQKEKPLVFLDHQKDLFFLKLSQK